jgi:polysaccharide export outer membrane protein
MPIKDLTGLFSHNQTYNLLMAITFFAFLSSCVTQRKVEYLQDKSMAVKTFNEADFPDYKLKPNDELYIQINSLDEGAANIFYNAGNQTSGSVGNISPYGASLLSYSIDKEGYLLMPVIGSIYAKGKTLSEVGVILKDSLNHILNQPVITIKLVNRYLTVLGEVNNPGHYAFSQEKISVYDAIGLAGDITDYGNRDEILLVRNENGQNKRVTLDLTKSDILSSDFYNLRPNDILYVKPLRNKFWGMRQFPFTVVFSTITTGLLIYNIFK